MRHHRFRLLICVALPFLLAAQSARARDDDDPGKDARIRVLVELLASKNPAPTERNGHVRVPKEYDKQAQVVVYLAIERLLTEGADAFDTLIGHLDDERYSCSFGTVSGGGSNAAVGKMCGAIMTLCIECYRCEIHKMTRDQESIYLYRDSDDENLADWWKANRNRPFWEIQVDAIEHAVKFVKSVDREEALPPYIDFERLSPEKFEELRNQNLKILEEMKASIEKRRQPYRPRSLQMDGGAMNLLPWVTAGDLMQR